MVLNLRSHENNMKIMWFNYTIEMLLRILGYADIFCDCQQTIVVIVHMCIAICMYNILMHVYKSDECVLKYT